ncbi:uncharacterized protein LOC122508333 [Leptopilina heterotoma]|uniref:uncharacterized protein LOC122508333 n=1 Tax=Leptopilina heterotoma TaxID=63436 RepID=UPI001CA9D496|nr:uncharacterized protein LOC122508333 [Leptopilina heterotoma]
MAANWNLKYHDVPEIVRSLSLVEERLVSPIIPFGQIKALLPFSMNSQLSFKGSVANIKVEINEMIKVLPRNFNELSTVQIKLKRHEDHKSHYMFETIKPSKICEALEHLIAFALPITQFGGKIQELSSNVANSLREKINDVQLLIIDEVSMVGSTTLNRVDIRLRQIKGVNDSFGGVSVILVGDLHQLPPVMDKPIYLTPNTFDLSILASATSVLNSVTDSTLEICHININSLKSNINLLRTHLSLFTYDVIASSETWLSESINDCMVDLSNFVLIRRDRIAVVYRRPGGENLDDFEYNFSRFFNLYDNVVICGDFNYNLNKISADSTYMRDFFESFNLYVVPFTVTHHVVSSSSWIDLCVVDSEDKIVSSSQSHVPFVAGHELISISYKWKSDNVKYSTQTYRNISGIDDEALLSSLNRIDWSAFYQSQSVDFKQFFVHNIIFAALEEHAPLRTHVIRKKVCPWMNGNIRDMLKQRENAFRAWKRSGSEICRSKFKTLRNSVKFSVRKAHDEYNAGRLNSIHDSGKLWKELRHIGLVKDKKDDVPLTFNVNILNNYFLSISGNSSFNITPSFISDLLIDCDFDENLFYFVDVCSSMLLKALNSIKSDAQGFDGVSNSAIMKFIPALFPYVLDLFNMSLQTSIFQEMWKRVLIRPIAKVKDPQQPGDYRPIAILSSLSKALEKIVYYQLNEFIECNDVLSPFQSGYRKGFSTQTLLVSAADDICRAIDQRKVTITVFFDFSKAFDMVPHTLLLLKLKTIGLSGSVLRWFASYLSGRTQAVVGQNEMSEWGDAGTGVPQVSVLGPLLFILFTKDLGSVLKYCKHMYFVDDLQIYLHSSIDDLNNNLALINDDVKSVFN